MTTAVWERSFIGGDDVVSLGTSRRARAGTAALATAALVLAGFSPAAAATVVEGDFEDGDGGWYAYGTTTSGVVAGEFCAEVPAGGDPWSAAVQHDSIDLVVGEDYVLSFDAYASAEIGTIVAQGGGEWPDVFQLFPTITTELEHFELPFTFAPGNGSTAEPGDVVAGNFGFQLGSKGSAFSICFDNISLAGAEVELLPQPSFPDAELSGGWGLSEGIDFEISDGVICIAQPEGSVNPWDVNLTINGVAIEEGKNYVLSFRASADPAQTPRVIVGENGGGYRTVLDQSPAMSPELQEFSFPFTAGLSFPAETGEDGFEGQVAFQIGKGAAYEFCLTDVSLVQTAAAPPPYVPDTGPRVRVNQHGYLPKGPKNATLVTDAAAPVAWQLRSSADAVVASGLSTPAGTDWSSGLDVHTIDFSSVTATGSGFTLVADGEASHPFDIAADVYQQLRYDALNYFYPVRSGIEIDGTVAGEAYARAAGHVGLAPNKGDLAVTCLTPEDDGASWSYGDWSCREGYALDVVGGWYDAGDHGKYVVNGGISVAQLLATYERALLQGTADALADGTLAVPETGNGVPDVLDEARWELEFFLSMQVPEGEELEGMVHHKIHDVGWTGLPLMPAADAQERRLHRPSTAATLNLAATAAQGARLFADHDPAFAAELLAAARRAWDAAQEHPELFAPAAAGNNGGGPYDDEDVSDELYWAAAELFVTTGEATFRDAVLANPQHTEDIFEPGGFFWGDVAALGRITLATVPNALPGLAAVRASIVEGAEGYLAGQQGEAFGTAYVPADGEYDWGSSSAVANTQVVLAVAYDLTGDVRFRDAVLESMDYLLGRNALNNSYITGYGEKFSKNQHSRWFANQLEPSLPNPPKGSLAGGPNSKTETWDPTMQATFTEGCTPSMCYLDHIQSWASNEITVNWNAALSQVASFVADQGDGSVPETGAAPLVTRHPASKTVALGKTAKLTAAATGEPAPTIQWQVRTKGSSTWKALKGENGPSLLVKVTAKVHGNRYRAVFTNTKGSATTKAAKLSVKAAKPRIASKPRSAQGKLGKKVSFSVKVSGFPTPKVTWQEKLKGGKWRTVKGAKGSRLSVKVTAARHGALYRAVAKNSQGKASSGAAKLSVAKSKPRIEKHPRAASVKAGKKARFTVKVSGFPAPKVRWQERLPGGRWTTVKGTKGKTLTVRASAARDGAKYRALVSNARGKVTSKAVRLTVR